MSTDSRSHAQYLIEAISIGDPVPDANYLRRDPVLKIFAAIRDARKAIRELLGESLNCCAVSPTGKLEVLEKDRLVDLHKQADELRKRAAHNEEILDRFDAAYTDALAVNPNLEPTLFAFKEWKNSVAKDIERGKNAIRVAAATWLKSEGANYTLDTIKDHPKVAREIAKYQPIIEAAEKELPIAEDYLRKVEAILSEAILPEKVDVIPAPNEYNQAILEGV